LLTSQHNFLSDFKKSIAENPSLTLVKLLGITALLGLLAFPEVSLITTNASTKNSAYSPYLFRLGFLTVADYLLAVMIFVLVILTYKTRKLLFGLAWPFLMIYFFYFSIGLFYNLFVYMETKAFFYDIKAFLYIFAPYLLIINLFKNFKINPFIVLNIILLLNFIGSFYDYFISKLNPSLIEYPIHSLYPSPLEPVIFPIVIALMYGWRHHMNIRWNYIYIILIFFGISSSILNYKLGISFQFLIALVALLAIHLMHITNSSSTGKLTILYYSLYVLIPTLFLFLLPSGGLKVDGMFVRINEIEVFFKLFFENIPSQIGKGLGATWPKDVSFYISGMNHNVGISFLDLPINFVWHNNIAGHFYKFGLIGSLAIVGYSAYIANRALLISSDPSLGKNYSIFISFAFLLVSYVTLILNGPGELKYGVIAGIILALYSQLDNLNLENNNL
jgi:hypothetical protein